MQLFAPNGSHAPDPVQRFSMAMMSVLVLLTFIGTNMQALLWQSSDWLVSTVLPAVVIDLTNDERVDNAAPELRRNSVLDTAAAAKAQHMADNEYFAHFAPDGTTPWKFFSDEGYVYAHAGENLAIHFTDSSEVVDAWMLSPAHRKNIVDPKFREIGVGTARGTFDGYDTVYVVQLFGTPAVAAPVVPAVTPPVAVVSPVLEIPAVVVEVIPEPTPAPVELAVAPVLETEPEPIPAAVLAAEDSAALVAPEPESVFIVQTAVVEPEPVAVAVEPSASEITTTLVDDVVVVQTELATSSGLAVATMFDSPTLHAGATIAAVATRPNLVLQFLYMAVASLIIISLAYALVVETRRLHYVQVAYSIALMFVMGGLWFLHTTLTSGAVII
jgi:uncharacterized protein YkwD